MRVRNVIWNFAGLASPLIVAALTVPRIIANVGLDRFGMLTIAWGLIGWAGIFDLGVGRAVTQSIGELRGRHRDFEIPAVIGLAERLATRSGAIGAGLLIPAMVLGVKHYLRYDDQLNGELVIAACLMAFAIPIQSISAMYRGVGEAFEEFPRVNVVRSALGVANFCGPFVVSILTKHLAILVATLLLSRVAALLAFRAIARRHAPASAYAISPAELGDAVRTLNGRLRSFGGWVTVSSVLYPIMTQADRLIIASTISAAAVSAYALPYELVTQSLILVGSITTTIFPSISAQLHADPMRAKETFSKWLAMSCGIMGAVALFLYALIPKTLEWWLGHSVPDGAASVGRIMCLGLVPYAVGTMYVAIIHAHGWAKITAISHAVQTPVFLFGLYVCVERYGIQGAAFAWVIRIVFDAILIVTWFRVRASASSSNLSRA